MANPVILIAAAGAAVLLLSGKKKGRGRGKSAIQPPDYKPGQHDDFQPGDVPPKPPEGNTAAPAGQSAGVQIWIDRQKAMKYLADMKVCNSDPGSIDGKYGPATKNAIYGLQSCMGMIPTGKWSTAIDQKLPILLTHAFTKAVEAVEKHKSAPKAGSKWQWDTWRKRQMLMNSLADDKTCNIEKVPVDGKYGPATKNAIYGLQSCLGLIPTGEWSKEIEQKLDAMFERSEREYQAYLMLNEIGYKQPSLPVVGIKWWKYDSPTTGFQVDWNEVLALMQNGILKPLPGFKELGKLEVNGTILDTRTITASGIVIGHQRKGHISKWEDVVYAARDWIDHNS